MVKFVNRAKMTTSTTGTGTLTLVTALSGFQSFAASGVVNADIVTYVIEDGTAWEIGNGVYTSVGTTLSRSLLSSSTGSLLVLTGNAVVYVSVISQTIDDLYATKANLASPALTGNVSVTSNSANAAMTVAQSGAGEALNIAASDLRFSDTGQRILGDFSSATETSRLVFQTTTVNGATGVGLIPNGTSNTSELRLINNSAPTNASRMSMIVNSAETSLRSGINGTGTLLPMTFHAGGAERLSIATSGSISAGSGTTNITYSIGGDIYLPADTTEGRAVQIGNGRTGNGNAYIDFVGDATYTDYGLRLIRSNGGADTNSQLIHRGLGGLYLTAQDAGFLGFQTTNTTRFRIGALGQWGIGNPADYGTSGQVMTSGGSGAAPSWESVGTATAGLAAGAVGSYAFCNFLSLTTAAAGSTTAGSSLIFSNAQGANGSGTPSGTWRLMGRTSNNNASSSASLFLRTV